MTRNYRLNDTTPYTVDLIVDGTVTATLPFTELIDAHSFGAEFVERGTSSPQFAPQDEALAAAGKAAKRNSELLRRLAE